MTDKTDALLALAEMRDASAKAGTAESSRDERVEWDRYDEAERIVREALAEQPAPPAASVDVEGLRTIIGDGIGGIRAEALTICNVTYGLAQKCSDRIVDRCDKVSKKLQALIDSAGGAKDDFCTTEGHVTGGTDSCINCGIPRPAEGDGAVEMHVRHEGSGLLALYNGDKQIREIGITPGWHFKDRDEFIFRYNNYTRPATTAAVPAFDFDRARALIGYVTGYCNATTLKTLTSDASVALGDLAAMLAAAPAAPKGEVVDEAMARRYLAAQKDYIGKVDAAFGRQVAGALHGDDVIGACMAGLTAALATPRAEQGGQEVGK